MMKTNTIIKSGVIAGLLIGVSLIQYFSFKRGSRTYLNTSFANDTDTDQKQSSIESKRLQQETATKKDTILAKEQKLVEIVIPQTARLKNTSAEFPLKLHSKGFEVTQLQMYLLNQHGWAEVTMGTFDNTTQKRTERFLKVSEVTKALYDSLIKKTIKIQ